MSKPVITRRALCSALVVGLAVAAACLEGLPTTTASRGGCRLSARSAKPGIEVKIVYLQSTEDPAAAREAAFALIAGGADVSAGKLNAGHAGIIPAAKEKRVY